MLFEILLASVVFLTTYFIYKWFICQNDYFSTTQFKYIKPSRIFGNSFELKSTGYEAVKLLGSACPNEKIYGYYVAWKPRYFINDLELIKQITVKDFDYFEDHTAYITEQIHKLFGSSLVNLSGQKWRDMRATLSPTFTGSKMRQMFELIAECSGEMAEYFQQQTQNDGYLDCNIKELFGRTTLNVIASCAFGWKINTLVDVNNEFYSASQELGFHTGWKFFKYIVISAFPTLTKWLGIELFDKKVCQYFTNVVLDNMDARERGNIQRPDMINLLMPLRKGKAIPQGINENSSEDGFATVDESHVGTAKVSRQWTDTEIVAQCLVFFMAGSDSSSNLLTFICYELSRNPEIQQILFEEIKKTDENLNGKTIDYDTLQKMKYMDQVVCETLRLWPQGSIMDRLCVKDYRLPFPGGESLEIKKGQTVNLSPYLLHTNPEYFPNPEQFKPNRFSEEARASIVPGTYIPFGLGPRNCIGSRFALMQAKVIIYNLILNFMIEANDKSEIPIKLAKVPFNILPANGFDLRLKRRK